MCGDTTAAADAIDGLTGAEAGCFWGGRICLVREKGRVDRGVLDEEDGLDEEEEEEVEEEAEGDEEEDAAADSNEVG